MGTGEVLQKSQNYKSPLNLVQPLGTVMTIFPQIFTN